jgi:DnaK suppressor protein
MTETEKAETERRLLAERDEANRLIGALSGELEEIIESVLHSNNDDEHDPDGATNGYERAKATALLRHAEGRLVELDLAADRLRHGTYGRCERCRGEIAAERLDALPTTTRCTTCAGLPPGS